MAGPRVLVVEDDPAGLACLVRHLSGEGYEVATAATGEAAWSMIEASPGRFDLVLLERRMLHTPVVMQTAMAADADVVEGERAGQTLNCLKSACFAFRTPAEARDIAALAANATPDPGRVVIGLWELMLNAVEHGNLGIGYGEKSRLTETGRVAEEIARRLALPEYEGRRAELTVERRTGRVDFLIRDQGAGFNWGDFLELSSDRAFDTHGRGIAMARRLSFDFLEYRGCGNEVLASVLA